MCPVHCLASFSVMVIVSPLVTTGPRGLHLKGQCHLFLRHDAKHILLSPLGQSHEFWFHQFLSQLGVPMDWVYSLLRVPLLRISSSWMCCSMQHCSSIISMIDSAASSAMSVSVSIVSVGSGGVGVGGLC